MARADMSGAVGKASEDNGDDIPRDIALKAVKFWVELHSGDLDDREQQALQAELSIWLQSQPLNQRAWTHIEQQNRRLALPAQQQVVVQQALQSAPHFSRREAIKMLSLLLFGGSGWYLHQQRIWRPLEQYQSLTADIRTGVGEQRTLSFNDFQLAVNTDSAVDVFYSPQRAERVSRLQLIRGEIALNTDIATSQRLASPQARQPTQQQALPLAVELEALGCRVEAQQAHFSLYQYQHQGQNHCRLTVMAGEVQLLAHAESELKRIQAGQQLLLNEQGQITQQTLAAQQINQQSAWQRGVLVAANMRLQDFLAELSRYRVGHLRCADDIADLRISGSYPLADTDRILAALEKSLPVKMHYLSRYFVTAQRRV